MLRKTSKHQSKSNNYQLKKAQSSIEFLILIGAIFFFFLLMLFIFQQNLSQKSIEKRNLEVLELAEDVKNELDIAAGASDGYQRTFQIQEKIIGQDYTISIVDELIYIQTADGKISLALPAQNVTGQLVKGNNTIRKTNGEILLN